MLEKNHGENFSLHHFFKSSGITLNDRVRGFSDYYRQSLTEGLALFGRELNSPPGPRVLVRDQKTGVLREMIMLGSNNYLGLANHPAVKAKVIQAVEKLGVGMGGPPLLNGTNHLHRELEKALAQKKGHEDALLFASGFQANLGWVTSLLRSEDILIYDELSHASFYDGLRLLRSSFRTKAVSFIHNDLNDLERILKESCEKRQLKQGMIIVAVEGVYSMDGDLAPLDKIAELCGRYDAALVVDDAHGTGVLGPCGEGTAEHFGVSSKVDISMGTFSKSFAVTGGFLTASQQITDYLRFFSRSYMFSAHLPTPIVAAVLGGLEVIKAEPAIIGDLHRNAQYLCKGLTEIGFSTSTQSAIIPVMIPEHINSRLLNRRFHDLGIFLNAIEYPAVPLNEQRLRLSVMANHSQQDLDEVISAFAQVGNEFQWWK